MNFKLLEELEKVESINKKWLEKNFIRNELNELFSILEDEDISISKTEEIVDLFLNEVGLMLGISLATAAYDIYKKIQNKYEAQIDHCDQYDDKEDKEECIFKAKEMFLKYKIKILEKSKDKCEEKVNMKKCLDKIKKTIYDLNYKLKDLQDNYKKSNTSSPSAKNRSRYKKDWYDEDDDY